MVVMWPTLQARPIAPLSTLSVGCNKRSALHRFCLVMAQCALLIAPYKLFTGGLGGYGRDVADPSGATDRAFVHTFGRVQ